MGAVKEAERKSTTQNTRPLAIAAAVFEEIFEFLLQHRSVQQKRYDNFENSSGQRRAKRRCLNFSGARERNLFLFSHPRVNPRELTQVVVEEKAAFVLTNEGVRFALRK